jgi:hypothetical protein
LFSMTGENNIIFGGIYILVVMGNSFLRY